jgi:hypothetical protein
MAGIFSQDWFSKGTGATSFVNAHRKATEDALTQEANLATLKGSDPNANNPAPAKPSGNIFARAAGATGNFIKNAAVDLKNTTVDTAKGLTTMVESPFKEAAANHANDLALQKIHESSQLTKDWTAADYQDPNKQKQLHAILDQAKQYSESAQAHTAGDKINTLNAKKLAFEAGETAINVGTLGIGDVALQGGKAAVKQGIKSALIDVAKSGGKEGMDQLIQHAAEVQAAKMAAEEAAKVGAVNGARKLAGTAGKDALIGTGFGVTSTGAQNPDASAAELAKGGAMGGILGGLAPVVGNVLKKGFTKLTDTAKASMPKTPVPGEIADTTPRNPDGSVDINKMLNDSVEAAANKHKDTFLGKIANVIGQHANPLGFAREIDQKAADRMGVDYKNLPADQSIEHLIQSKGNVDNIVNTLAREKTSTGASFQDLAKKYAGDTPEAKEFNNYTVAKYDLDRRNAETGGGARQEVLGGQKTEDLQKFVSDYEKRNPEAAKDAATKTAFYQHATEQLHAGGLISDKELKDITSSSDVATPFNRIFADKEALDGMASTQDGAQVALRVKLSLRVLKAAQNLWTRALDVVLGARTQSNRHSASITI